MERIERLFTSSRITPAFWSKTFENFTTDRPEPIQKMFRCAKDYSDRFTEVRQSPNNWLALLGEPGSGKTHLSMAVCNELIKQNIPTLYFQHVEGMKELVGMVSQKLDISPKKEQMKQVDVLYWDDLFKPPRKPSEFDVETAFEIINYRYLNLLPTIISSERDLDGLIEIDNATGSRIAERAKGHLMRVKGIELNYRLEG